MTVHFNWQSLLCGGIWGSLRGDLRNVVFTSLFGEGHGDLSCNMVMTRRFLILFIWIQVLMKRRAVKCVLWGDPGASDFETFFMSLCIARWGTGLGCYPR